MWPRIPGAPASVPSALCLHIEGVYVWGCLGGMCGCGTGRQVVRVSGGMSGWGNGGGMSGVECLGKGH